MASQGVAVMIRDAQMFSRTLLKLADDKVEDRNKSMSITQHYPYVLTVFPSKMIMPLQDALTCSLPSTTDTLKTHNPFPGSLVEIKGRCICVLVMFSADRSRY
jgi:serine/threonine-protein kinase ATR